MDREQTIKAFERLMVLVSNIEPNGTEALADKLKTLGYIEALLLVLGDNT